MRVSVFLVVSVWRWIALLLVAWAAPPLIARSARAISLREKRKKECPHLFGRVRELLHAEFPGIPVDSPSRPFSWFTEPELASALMTPSVFSLVVPGAKLSQKEIEYVARYGGGVGAQDLRIYVHASARPPSNKVDIDGTVVSVHAVTGCPCGTGAGALLNANQ
jgi:hypothetical protein